MVIKANAEVWTKDGVRLGTARRWHFRPEEQVHPEDLLFASYLEVENYDLGDSFFVPDMYLVDPDDGGDRVLIEATMKQVEHWTWTRTPNFVAANRGGDVFLPEETTPGATG